MSNVKLPNVALVAKFDRFTKKLFNLNESYQGKKLFKKRAKINKPADTFPNPNKFWLEPSKPGYNDPKRPHIRLWLFLPPHHHVGFELPEPEIEIEFDTLFLRANNVSKVPNNLN